MYLRAQGHGPADATLCVVTDANPATTDLALQPYFTGTSLPRREDVFITSLIPDLQLELSIVQPELICAVGPAATRRFLGDAVPFAWMHGLPHQIPQCVVFPCVNPLHAPEAMVAYDVDRLAQYLWGQLGVRPKDQHLSSQYVLDTTHSLLYPDEPLALVTHGPVEDPWCLAYAQHPGIGHVVRPPAQRLTAPVREQQGTIILHDALHHLPILRALGIDLPHLADTKVMASLLGESLDLEVLAYRYCGMGLTPCDPRTTPHPETAIRYLGRQADALLRLYPLLEAQILARGLEDTLTRDLAVLLKIDLLRQAGEFTDLSQFAFLSSSVWPEKNP